MLPAQIADWNQTRRDYPLERPLTSFLEEQARKTPELPAVVFENTLLTYADLNRRANRLARQLNARGIGTDALVGVYMERSIEMVVALVGIVKAGAAYVPLDPEYPQDRLAFMFEDAQIRVLVTQRRLAQPSAAAGLDVIYLDDPAWAAVEAADREDPPLQARPDSAAYMIYTSGSTGKPKGVVNVHRGLVNRLLWMQEAFQLGPIDRVLQKTPYSFDVSVWEFFWPLITGACLVMARPGGHRDTHYLVDTIVDKRVTTLHFVPSMLSLFLTSDELGRIRNLRQVMASGEALPLELCRRFFAKLPHAALHNLYGPTEAAIDVTHWPCTPDSTQNVVPIGRPIANIQTYILDEQRAPVPVGAEGELYLGGVGLARGYWNRPELTAERFVPDPFSAEPGARLYKTGDLCRYLPDGAIEYLGRLDFQIKLRGFRIELGEIEAALLNVPGVLEAVVIATDGTLDDRQLLAYLVAAPDQRPSPDAVRGALRARLPEYMVPARLVFLDEMPRLPNGKVDRKALPTSLVERPELGEMYVAPQTPLQKQLCEIWANLLGIRQVGLRDNFFELGGNSIRAVRLAAELKRALRQEVPVVKLFEHPSIEKFAEYLTAGSAAPKVLDDANERATRMRIGRFSGEQLDGVAVIGMVGRFPGARSVDELWANLLGKVESIDRFPLDEIDVDDEIKHDPDYVPTRGIITDADKFDARFFGIGPLEAKAMDPQQRIFLELAWAALEHAGYDSERFPGLVGVYAGVGDNHYHANNLLGHPDLLKTVGKLIVGYGNEKDYIATRASYHLNLTGPSVSANTGCSTSLLAVDHAFRGLIDFECDLALAGGVDVFFPQKSGQIYKEGGTFTRDGHCRPFDHEATGTMFCDGAGIVVLRRLEDALAAGDRIYAVIRGIAKNNDGSNKVSFLAPGVEGQVRVIALAQAQANVPARSISYHEAHGTGTPLGDPIEVEAATRAFGATTSDKQFCWLGSIKGNIGHPTIASGVAGLIKVCLALHHETIPATINFNQPNPRIDFANSPFKLVTDTTPWPRTASPRRASVSSFGFGGTNVHAVLEEAPVAPPSGAPRPQQLVLLSGKSDAAVERLRASYAEFLAGKSLDALADMAYTTQVGRRHLACRQFVVAGSSEQAIAALKAPATVGKISTVDPAVVFMFPGQGSQYPNMARSLYDGEPLVREAIDACCARFRPHLDRDLKDVIFPPPDAGEAAAALLKDTRYTQPALFTVEYALARYWMSLGVAPATLVGHSVAEFVCACIAGALELDDAIPLVALRARLMGSMPPGSMLSVRAAAAAVRERLPADLQLAANNAPKLCVVAGPSDSIAAFAAVLEQEGVFARPLQTSHAFHSSMMEPIVGEFMAAVGKTRFAPPRIPILSTCLADWMTAELLASPEYWGRQLRMPVLFSDAIGKLTQEPGKVFLEVGPKDVLSALTRQHVAPAERGAIVTSLGSNTDAKEEAAAFLRAVGGLWSNGKSVDWAALHAGETRRRIAMPTYPFERTSYFVAPVKLIKAVAAEGADVDSALTAAADAGAGGGAGGPVTILDRIKDLLATVGGMAAATVDPNKTYLEMGFDSLGLMQLEVVVAKDLGVKVTWRQLLEDYATPAKLEALVRAQNPALDVPAARPLAEAPIPVGQATSAASGAAAIPGLTALREAGPKALFLAYDGEGDVLQYLKLARAMPPEFSLYGISPLRMPNVPQVHTRVEDMASHCVSVMRKQQPRGPYLVGGLCAGGVIAFEMAAQLEAAGEKVDWVVLLDTINPQTPFRPFLRTRSRLRRLLNENAASASAPTGEAQTPAAAKPGVGDRARQMVDKARNLIKYEVDLKVDGAWVAARIALLRGMMRSGGKWPASLTAPRELEIYMAVKDKYHPGVIAADLVLVRATMDAEGVDAPAKHFVADPFYGWQGHTRGRLATIEANGGHVSMLLDEPWFGELAEKLGAVLLSKATAPVVEAPVAAAAEQSTQVEAQAD